MKSKPSKRYLILLVSFIVFIAASFVYRDARYNWNNIPYMVIPDVILSLASAVMAVCVFWDKKTVIKIISCIAGFLVPNAFIWGVSMGLKAAISDGGMGTAIAFILMFLLYGIFALLVFLKKLEKKKLTKITAVILAFIFGVSAGVCADPLTISDTLEKYDDAVEKVEIFENDFETAVPMTKIHDIVENHFSSPLADGKTEKKCVVIGFDGTRADVFNFYTQHEKSAIKEIMADNGHAVLGYCGGANWPENNTQQTSTGPGWCSILTGLWADETGITKNSVPKSLDYKTLFLSLIEDNFVDSTKFCVSWGGHFNSEDSTYYPEKQYAEQNGINASFVYASNDDGTFENVQKDLTSADCTDFLFCIFEQCDHVGHDSNFTPENDAYVDAFENDDKYAYDILEMIKSRPTYDTEDWLILITTDHGGHRSSHGGSTKQERYTFIVANKELGS